MIQSLRPGDWSAGEIIQFGPFCLFPGERRLERDGTPVKIGDRALDVLLCLIANAPDVVGKAALIKQVWPNLIVEEVNVRVAAKKQVPFSLEDVFISLIESRRSEIPL